MEWFKELYDEFRMKRGFGSVPQEKTSKEVDFIVDVLNLSDGAKVLDLLCGTGRHSIELAKRGYIPVGIEYNSKYLKLARKKAKETELGVRFIQGDVRDVDFGADYEGIIVMYQSFGYFSDEEDRMVLEKIHKALKPNGRFLLEIISKDWLLHNFVSKEESTVEDILVSETREFDTLSSRVNFTIERHLKQGVVTKKGSWRIYSASEIICILEDIGFKYIAGYNDLDKTPLTEHTRLMRLVFEKQNC